MKPIVLFFQSTYSKSWRDKLTGVFQYADEVGWHVQIIENELSTQLVRHALQKWNPVGCLIDRGNQNARAPLHVFGRLPIVFLDQKPCPDLEYTSLNHDSNALIDLALSEFSRLGLKHLVYASYAKPRFWDRERHTVFERLCRARHLNHTTLTTAHDIGQQLAALEKPCGIICANDLTAQTIISEAACAGIDIPHSVAVIGIDNDELICEHTNPPLTSILPDFVTAGYRLAQMLHRRILNPKTAHVRATYGPQEIVRRASSNCLPNADRRITDALAYIQRNFADPNLSVQAVVKIMGCSRSLADLLFRKTTGGSILDEIQRVRLAHACTLLRNPRQQISAIANLCGYRSEPFFKRLFKRHTGHSMRTWRLTQRGY